MGRAPTKNATIVLWRQGARQTARPPADLRICARAGSCGSACALIDPGNGERPVRGARTGRSYREVAPDQDGEPRAHDDTRAARRSALAGRSCLRLSSPERTAID